MFGSLMVQCWCLAAIYALVKEPKKVFVFRIPAYLIMRAEAAADSNKLSEFLARLSQFLVGM